jgi:hypothetical protein
MTNTADSNDETSSLVLMMAITGIGGVDTMCVPSQRAMDRPIAWAFGDAALGGRRILVRRMRGQPSSMAMRPLTS